MGIAIPGMPGAVATAAFPPAAGTADILEMVTGDQSKGVHCIKLNAFAAGTDHPIHPSAPQNALAPSAAVNNKMNNSTTNNETT
jgi:hypothetical protein